MINITSEYKIYLACGHTDMRKSINGLQIVVERDFKLDAYDKNVFVFCNKNKDRIKILVWEENGFYLLLKRLELGRFKWPLNSEISKTMNFTKEELIYLLKGPYIEQKLKRKELKIQKTI